MGAKMAHRLEGKTKRRWATYNTQTQLPPHPVYKSPCPTLVGTCLAGIVQNWQDSVRTSEIGLTLTV